MKNVEQILAEYLTNVGADGLCDGAECGCTIDSGLMDCEAYGGVSGGCVPSRSHTVTDDEVANGVHPGFEAGDIILSPIEDNDGDRDE